MLGHDSLMNHFKTNFALIHHHKYSLSELEDMLPWERMLYVDLLKQHLKQLEQDARDQAMLNKRRR